MGPVRNPGTNPKPLVSNQKVPDACKDSLDRNPSRQAVSVKLKDIHPRDSHPIRFFTLTPDNPTVVIGRSSNRSDCRYPPSANFVCFDSPVISRQHAEITYDRSTEEVSVRDLGSLHGISLNGVDLVQWQSKPVSSGDTVVVGSEIVRGTKHHYARSFRVEYRWHSSNSGIAQSTIANVTTTTQQTQSNPLVKAHVLLDDTASESETHNQKHELRLAVNESVLREAVTQFRKKDSLPTQPVKDATQLNPPDTLGASRLHPMTIEDEEPALVDLTQPPELIDLSQDDTLHAFKTNEIRHRDKTTPKETGQITSISAKEHHIPNNYQDDGNNDNASTTRNESEYEYDYDESLEEPYAGESDISDDEIEKTMYPSSPGRKQNDHLVSSDEKSVLGGFYESEAESHGSEDLIGQINLRRPVESEHRSDENDNMEIGDDCHGQEQSTEAYRNSLCGAIEQKTTDTLRTKIKAIDAQYRIVAERLRKIDTVTAGELAMQHPGAFLGSSVKGRSEQDDNSDDDVLSSPVYTPLSPMNDLADDLTPPSSAITKQDQSLGTFVERSVVGDYSPCGGEDTTAAVDEWDIQSAQESERQFSPLQELDEVTFATASCAQKDSSDIESSQVGRKSRESGHWYLDNEGENEPTNGSDFASTSRYTTTAPMTQARYSSFEQDDFAGAVQYSQNHRAQVTSAADLKTESSAPVIPNGLRAPWRYALANGNPENIPVVQLRGGVSPPPQFVPRFSRPLMTAPGEPNHLYPLHGLPQMRFTSTGLSDSPLDLMLKEHCALFDPELQTVKGNSNLGLTAAKACNQESVFKNWHGSDNVTSVLAIENILNKPGENSGRHEDTDANPTESACKAVDRAVPIQVPEMSQESINSIGMDTKDCTFSAFPKQAPLCKPKEVKPSNLTRRFQQEAARRCYETYQPITASLRSYGKALLESSELLPTPCKSLASSPLKRSKPGASSAHTVVDMPVPAVASKKRKAEEMASEETELPQVTEIPLGSVNYPLPATCGKTSTVPTTASEVPAVSQAPAQQRKRARFMDTAAPFLLGAMAGGVTLFTALVTLPESFF